MQRNPGLDPASEKNALFAGKHTNGTIGNIYYYRPLEWLMVLGHF